MSAARCVGRDWFSGLALLLLASVLAGPAAAKPLSPRAAEAFVLDHLGLSRSNPDTALRTALVDLNGDGAPEALVYVRDRSLCGGGGCNLYVLEAKAGAIAFRGRMTIVGLPIRVLASRSHGWSDLGVWTSGGGVEAHEARLRYDGRRYPPNPSLAPIARRQPGKTAIADEPRP